MKHAGYEYEIRMRISFTRAEIERLRWLAEMHYDHACRALSIPGDGAFLNGLWHSLPIDSSNPEDTADVALTCRQLDTLRKVLEQGQDAYDAGMFLALGRIWNTAAEHGTRVRASEAISLPLLEQWEPKGKPGPTRWGVLVTGSPVDARTFDHREAAEDAALKAEMHAKVHPVWIDPKGAKAP